MDKPNEENHREKDFAGQLPHVVDSIETALPDLHWHGSQQV